MSKRLEGSLAFPLQASQYGGHGSEPGMPLRAYFAGKFCAAMVSTIQCDEDYNRVSGIAVDQGCSTVSKWFAKEACKQADALIAELSK